MNEPTKKYITLAEAAKTTGRSHWTLRDAIRDGSLRAMQFAKKGTYFIKPEDLDRYFEQHTVNPLAGRIV